MVDEMANHGIRVENYANKYGRDKVEDFIDACSSIENLIDATALFDDGPSSQSDDVDMDASINDIPRIPSKSYMDPFVNPPEVLERKRVEMHEARAKEAHFPEKPVKDVLGFLAEYAPLPNWKRDILSIVREEAYYFAPQAQTKIMNEGWASYWHEKIMTEKALDSSELVDFADHHSSTLAMQPGQLNPYKLGYELFHDIERRWNNGRFGRDYDECRDMREKMNWNTGAGLGREKIFQVRSIYNDMTFIDDFLTEEFVRENGLFAYGYNKKSGMYEIESRDFQVVKEKLFVLTDQHGTPTHHDCRW